MSCLALLVLALTLAQAEHQGVCNLSFCQCLPAPHPSWTIINCTLNNQRMDILEGDIPDTATDLIITGADTVLFGTNALSRLKDARRIQLSKTNMVVMRSQAAVSMNVVSLYLEMDSCEIVRIEEKTFTDIKGPLSVTIKDCHSVTVEGEAFSWLLTLTIENAPQLMLGPGAFHLDPTAGNVGEHGPGMTIELRHVSVQEFPNETFRSSAAEIRLHDVEVAVIRSGAFSANTYNVVIATNCTFHLIEANSFAQKSLINNLQFYGCKIKHLKSKAMKSAISKLHISNSTFEEIDTGAINATVASVEILDSEFKKFQERGFELSSWNKLQMKGNKFDYLASNAIVAPGSTIAELIFADNDMETVFPESLRFIGKVKSSLTAHFIFRGNYFGKPCYCGISYWIATVLGISSASEFLKESYCTVDELIARCFSVPDANMIAKHFIEGVCITEQINCPKMKSKELASTAIKNPRFPHRKDSEGLSKYDKKVIGIVVVTILGCVIIVIFISLVRWMRRKGYCFRFINFIETSNCSSGEFGDRYCGCSRVNGTDNAESISQISVHEYSERHRLNEPHLNEAGNLEAALPDVYAEEVVPSDDKITQTMPEELTKELIEDLRDSLNDPERYVETMETIKHLYALIKVKDFCNANTPTFVNTENENIYELPFQNTTSRIGKNKKKMISIGTKVPSLDKLLPLSPYSRKNGLRQEYFEPKDFTIHVYAEVENCKRNYRNNMPDVVGEQAFPRGPYLRAVCEKNTLSPNISTSPSNKSFTSSPVSSLQNSSPTMKSNISATSNSSGRMQNRPLPAKPKSFYDPGEGTSGG